jgi:hypothetical protein
LGADSQVLCLPVWRLYFYSRSSLTEFGALREKKKNRRMGKLDKICIAVWLQESLSFHVR